ncbi:MAG: ABC-type transport auxiliary lipoprotein family protein [Janthinobacterium lividum]
MRLLAISAPAELDTDRLCYRLIYAEPNRARFYADSSWTARPAQLLARRLKLGLGAAAHLDAVLDASDPGRAPLLKIELLEFAQYFDAPGRSRGVVSLRATLFNGDLAIAQQPFVAQVSAPSADAAGGAQALASASDQAIAALAAWLLAHLGP